MSLANGGCPFCCILKVLTPGHNFINIVLTAFMHADPRSVKKTVKLSIFFTLLGSTSIKAAPKMLVKLTPVFDFFFLKQQKILNDYIEHNNINVL